MKFFSKYKGLGTIEFLLGVLVMAILSAIIIPGMLSSPGNKTATNGSISSTKDTFDFIEYKQLYRAVFSDASQSWKELYSSGELSPRNGWGNSEANYSNFSAFMKKFVIIKECTYPNNSGCWATNETPNVAGNHPFQNSDRCFVDNSGRAWCEAAYSGWFIVDVNDLKAPNRFGRDRFIFYTMVGNNANTSGIPDKITTDIDYKTVDADKCPNPPCLYSSWIN